MPMDLKSLLHREKLVGLDTFDEASSLAHSRGIHLVDAILEVSDVTEDVFADAVARAIGSVVIDVHRGTLEPGSVRLIPELEARRLLAIPVARGPAQQLRVAFVNPLDPEPYRVVESITGMTIDPLVATVSGVHAVLDREWKGRTTEITELVRARPEVPIPEESTRQISADEKRLRAGSQQRSAPPSDPSAPTAKAAVPTSAERHEALLLTLIEKGILSRADYHATLGRLMDAKKEKT